MAKNAAIPEDENKARLRAFLPKHFLFLEEVTGHGPTGAGVRIDFWCYPKGHLVMGGWPKEPFGIEVKSGDLEDHRKRTAVRIIYQSAVYQSSQFLTKQGLVHPHFVLIYPGLPAILGLPENQRDRGDGFMDGVKFALERLAAMFRVGELWFSESDFEVRFNGARWFSLERGMSAANPLGKATDRASR